MKKVFLIGICIMFINKTEAQKNTYNLFENSDLIFIPDENKTYFVEDLIESEDSDGNSQIQLIGIKGSVRGNYIDVLNRIEPSLRPIVKDDHHRKDVNPLPNTHFITCVKGGRICVILLKKNQFPQ